jgi:hypothetical protein
MLQILSSLTLVSRFDLTADAWTLASGQTGTFVEMSGDAIQKPTAGNFAVPVWSESNRDGSAGFSPDIAATGKVTVIYGKLKGVTDQYVGTPAVGAPLFVDANGKLTVTASGNGVVVAYCTKAQSTVKYLSKSFNAIEFVLA